MAVAEREAEAGVERRYIPINRWPEFYPWPSISALRMLIFRGDENGFSSCVVRVGRKVLIDESAFHSWVEQHKDA